MGAAKDRLLWLLSTWLLVSTSLVVGAGPEPPCPTDGSGGACQAGAIPEGIESGDRGAQLAPLDLPHQDSGAPEGSPPAPPVPNGAVSPGTIDPSRLEVGLGWDYCGTRPARLGRLPRSPAPGPDTPLVFSADALVYDENSQILTLSGAIKAQRGNQFLEAEHIRYDRGQEYLVAEGDALFGQPELRILGSAGEFDIANRTGRLDRVYYRLIGNSNARGTAAEARILDDERSHYRDIRYTTCPPGDNAWALDASELEIDREAGTGTTWHTKLRVGDVPIFYWPYLSFPIDGRRKSGFLVPSVGISQENGLDLKVPYYFNLAPNMDFTFYPRIMSKRGLMLGGEFRYLTNDHRGKLYGELLPRDAEYQDKVRGAASFVDRGTLAPGWTTDININYVSDDSYLEDFGNNLQETSLRNLERRGDVAYTGQDLYLLGRVQEFQTIEAGLPNVQRPYSRLPQLLALYDRPRLWSGLDMTIGGEYNYFGHQSLVHGQRFSLRPSVSWPFRASYGYLKPSFILNHSTYSLTNQAPGQPNSPSHTLPTANLDGSLVFERPWEGFGKQLIQTLEPRLYYLYTPYQNQQEVPVFDSAQLDLSYANMFRENRFTGRDRIGDANQVTMGLTSRGLSQASGAELYRASIGQIWYFRDRRVQIAGPPQDDNTSPLMAEVAGRLSEGWSSRATLAWDPQNDTKKTLQRVLELRYQGKNNLLFNAAYRYNHDTQPSTPDSNTSFEDTDLSFSWPISPQLELVGRWYYSLLYNETMDAFAGVEYGRCCWRVRAVARKLKNQPGEPPSNSLMLQFELAGLGQLGHRVDRTFKQSILGYGSETIYGDLEQ